MNGSFELIDYLIFGLYAVTILSIGLWVSRDKKGKQKMFFKNIEIIKFKIFKNKNKKQKMCVHI